MAGRRGSASPRFSETRVPRGLVEQQLALKNATARAQDAERRNRAILQDTFFAGAPLGSSTLDTDDGRTVTLTMGQRYEVDVAELDALRPVMQEKFGINVDAMFSWKPSLLKTAYNTLSEEERAVFDSCLTIKDDSPQLKINEPKGWKPPVDYNAIPLDDKSNMWEGDEREPHWGEHDRP